VPKGREIYRTIILHIGSEEECLPRIVITIHISDSCTSKIMINKEEKTEKEKNFK
jgi:hypothetical protein